MGNAIGSFFSGFGQVLGALLGHPLDFLSGKSCNSICGPTWDFTCYVENFCISHLLKLAMVAALVYVVLLFFYLVYKLGICQCICHALCRVTWACFATCFSTLDCCCTYLCYKLRSVKRKHRRRKRDVGLAMTTSSTSEEDNILEELESEHHRNLGSTRLRSNKRRYSKEEHLRRSLKPNSHRAHVEFARSPTSRRKSMVNGNDCVSPIHHHVRVTRSSRFAQKGSRRKSGIHHRRR